MLRRQRLHLVLLWFLAALLSYACGLPLSRAAGREGEAEPQQEFEIILQRGFELERQGKWRQAVELYEGVAKLHPNSPLLRQRIRECRIHQELARRYRDTSFRDKLLGLPERPAWKLFDEVLERVDRDYVDPPDYAAMFRSGIEQLLVALEDPLFRRTNFAGADAHQVSAFRQRLYRWKEEQPRELWALRQKAAELTASARSRLGIRATPLLLEFLYGTFSALDQYCSCLTPSRLDDLYAVIDGNFVGIGVEVRSDERGLRVVKVIESSPAAEAGLRPADLIVAVNGVPMGGMTLEEAAGKLQGPAGTQVELWVLSPGAEQPRRLLLVRRPVQVHSVSYAALLSPGEGIGYVQLSGFQRTTVAELRQAIQSLQRQGMKALIIDLRANPGGLLSAAIELSDQFL